MILACSAEACAPRRLDTTSRRERQCADVSDTLATMRVSEAVGSALADLGVERVFGVIGSGNFAVTNSLIASGAQFLAARHECAAVSMADGYARVSRRVGVASVHQGPGLTNAMTGLAEAAKARTPLLLLAADTSAASRQSNFRIDQAALAGAVGAVPARVHGPESALSDVAQAWRVASMERRAVLLSLPLDVQAAELPRAQRITPPPALAPPAPGAGAIAEVADNVMAARSPAIVAGRGAVLADAGPALERLGDRIGAILATSANGNGLFAGHRWSVGISGGFASPAAASLMRESDLVLAFGASLNMWTTRHGKLIGPGARVVQVDVEPEAIGVHRAVDVGVVADASAAATAFEAELERRGFRAEGFRRSSIRGPIAGGGWRAEPFNDASDGERMDPRSLSVMLDDMLPAERLVAIDSGHFMGWPAMYVAVPDAAGFVFAQSFQSIGLGLASAIGASVARPDRMTVAFLGDGGALMSAGEFDTIARLPVPMLVVIYNDAAYGAEVHHFGPHGHPLDTVRFPETDFAALARGHGLRGITVRDQADFAALKEWVHDRDGSLVVDAKVRPDVVGSWLEEAFRAH
jgi:thiamine pyrophosphate-dependent acetolactate synthase large subunit-like protein